MQVQTAVFPILETFTLMRKTDMKTNNYNVLGKAVYYRHVKNIMGQEREQPHWPRSDPGDRFGLGLEE